MPCLSETVQSDIKLHDGVYVSGVVRAFNVHRQVGHSTDADSAFVTLHEKIQLKSEIFQIEIL